MNMSGHNHFVNTATYTNFPCFPAMPLDCQVDDQSGAGERQLLSAARRDLGPAGHSLRGRSLRARDQNPRDVPV